MIVAAIFAFILIFIGIIIFISGLGAALTPQGVSYGGIYMILGVILVGGGMYLNHKAGWNRNKDIYVLTRSLNCNELTLRVTH
jgi:uncharacterized membrane-anchored protein